MLDNLRSKHPQYDDLSDEQLAEALYSKFYSDMPKEEFMAKVMPQTIAYSGSTDEAPESLSEPLSDEGEGVSEGQNEEEEDYEVVIPVVGENGRKYKVKMLASEAKRRFADQLMLEGANA